jgi:hypothetical protein
MAPLPVGDLMTVLALSPRTGKLEMWSRVRLNAPEDPGASPLEFKDRKHGLVTVLSESLARAGFVRDQIDRGLRDRYDDVDHVRIDSDDQEVMMAKLKDRSWCHFRQFKSREEMVAYCKENNLEIPAEEGPPAKPS